MVAIRPIERTGWAYLWGRKIALCGVIPLLMNLFMRDSFLTGESVQQESMLSEVGISCLARKKGEGRRQLNQY